MRFGRFLEGSQRAVARLGLGVAGLVALLAGAVALVGSGTVFAVATEDVTQHNGLALHDAADLRSFTDHRPALLVHVARAATYAGAVPVVAVLALLATVLLWRRGLRLALALAPVVSLAVVAVAVSATKTVVGRARPPVALHLVSEGDASFPSGHAADSAAVLLTIAFVVAVFVLRRPIAQALVVLVAAAMTASIGVSRLVLGVHWPSDVLAGWALGVTVALAVTITAAVVARIARPSADAPDGRVRRLVWRSREWLALERRPHSDLRAA